ncbi:MAG TPA: oligopeptide:H+ symporter, partial [Myxococcota bacterium]|nr:oligopeptide:H+ symporter [Myxococcota bacterium]
SDSTSTDTALEQTLERLTRTDWSRIAVLLVLAVFGNIIFWAAFEQAGSSMSLFAENSTNLALPSLGWSMPSSWFQSANPLFIALLAPFFSILWVKLSRAGREPSTPMKFACGMFFVSLGFGAMVVAGQLYDQSGPVSMFWLTAAYFLNTCGELCVSPVGLSAVTKLAPPRYASVGMGLWFASMAIANWFSGQFAGEYESMSKALFFSVPAIMAGVAALVLFALVRPLRKMMHGVH